MGCPDGKCGVKAPQELEPGLEDAQLVADLADRSGSIDHGACCAHCSGVALDPTAAPVTPRELLEAGCGCPISIVAYRARKERDKGHKVQMRPRKNMVPALVIDGKEVDAMRKYKGKKGDCS